MAKTITSLTDEAINMSSMHFPIRKIHVIETLISAFESEREWIINSRIISYSSEKMRIKELTTCIQRLQEALK